jgi:SAM-dependent methyltransferase
VEIRSILRFPVVYETYQRLVGGMYMREESLRVLGPKAGHRVLDIGCGPAYYLKNMPDLEYHGFDTDPTYIEHARRKFGHRATFHCEPFTEETAKGLGTFDRVLMLGLLHHLNDEDCHNLLSLIGKVLRPGGRALALETVVHPVQNPIEHALAVNDRGEYVRHPEGFNGLAERHFSQVDGYLATRTLMPRIYWVMTMSEPKLGGTTA